MNFFNSIFSDDPESSDSPTSPPNDLADIELENPNSSNPNPIPESSSPRAPISSAWNFGSLIQTITTRSESVIGNYKRDFSEFGSGLLKETALIRDVASRAVKELPDSIDAGAAVAQESLESVGQAIDNLGSSVWQGTNVILTRGKELHLFDDEAADAYEDGGEGSIGRQLSERSLDVKRYSWFESRMREIQSDPRTYTEEPDELEDYGKWRSAFVLDEKSEEIERVMAEERLVERSYLELVPVTVDRERFWSRYFYRVEKLKQAEESRARIMRRAISGDDEEELSWDVDDDDDDEEEEEQKSALAADVNVSADSVAECEVGTDVGEGSLKQEDECKQVGECSENVGGGEIAEVSRVSDASEGSAVGVQEGKFSEGKVSGEKNDSSDSCKDSDLSIISRQPSFPGEEEELGWDEIDDVGSGDESKGKAGSSSNLSDMRKRLNAGDEEEEDLSWDIEDDDEPIKS